jgi:glutathione S-transferase
MFVLHHGWKSSASRRVRLCMAEKGLKFESRIVNLAKMEHHTPEYLALNPNGVIPLLILPDGRSLYESSVICEYLDETYREPPLRPTDPYLRAEMRNWIRHVDERIGNLIVFNWKHSIQKTASQWSDEELKERVAKIPSKERQEAWMRVARRPFTKEEEDAARAKLVLLLDRMEANLKQHAWLVGDAYSLADIGVVPFVKRIDEEIAPDEVSAQKHPRVLAWWKSIQSRPAFAEARIGSFV